LTRLVDTGRRHALSFRAFCRASFQCKYRVNIWCKSTAPAFIACVLLLVPIPLLITQSFKSLGDFTPESVLLALVTLLLPIGMIQSILLARRKWKASWTSRLNVLAAVFVLQWCVVLAASGMLPLRLWT
jgi:hypothetical protein